MSDDDFGDDSFFADASFLEKVDSIAASAQTTSKADGFARATSLVLPAKGPSPLQARKQGWTGVQRSVSGPSNHSFNRAFGSPKFPKPVQTSLRHFGTTPTRAPPSSDDYESLPLPAESLAAFDSIITARPPQKSPSSSKPSSARSIPSSRLGMGRTSSSNNDSFLQTHLNFRREKQSTKGKRWDRTQFAETGRKIGAAKGKGKTKGKRQWREWDDDEDDIGEEEDEWGEDLAPAPIPLVDMNAPYGPQRHLPNSATINTYIYPTNRSKRGYQFEIVKQCFTNNCLVALPTGLGKTFVAGVVMLNFYRWFPTGKIVFLAPTRPLVNQQIEACQLSCGIPSKDAAVMTGQSVTAKERARLWEDRRVFYCTPQTLDNDLKRGAVDPRDIVLAVFDEAHKASGSYAYTTILAYITAHHPYFRVLALTATPGADVPRVQAVVDALHISRIEIREAEAPEIRKYMNEKHTEKHVVPMSDVIADFRDRWAALMRPNVQKLVDKDILNDRDLDTKRLRPFRLTAKRMEIARDRTSGLRWAIGSLTALEKMSRAMGYLLEFSIGMFHTTLVEIAGGTNASGKKSTTKGSANSIRNNTEFQRLLRDVEVELNMIRIGKDGRSLADKHPKMQQTLDLLLAHFAQAEEEEETLGQKNDTRAMVFCSFRGCVLEVVDMLNQHPGLLRATKFVGQSQGKAEEDKGFKQKDQKKTINDFKDGKFNVLVSTSIGEEGLDIGEVDFVVIYDMPKQSIKLLQRIGRTGRKRDGEVHVLMSEGREDLNWDTAQQTHRDIQEEILHSRNLELFEDVEPLVPMDQPLTCLEQEMEIDPWDPTDQKASKALAEVERMVRKEKEKAEPKAKGTTKGKGRGHQVPEGAEGFQSVADLLRGKGKLGKRKAVKQPSDEDGEEEEEEEAEERRPVIKSKPRPSVTKREKKRIREPSPVRSVTTSEEEDLENVFDKMNRRTPTRAKPTRRAERPSVTTEPAAVKSVPSATVAAQRVSVLDLIGEAMRSDPETPEDGSPRRPLAPIAVEPNSSKPSLAEASHPRSTPQDVEAERGALDFFHTQGPARKGTRTSSPMMTPPTSPEKQIVPLFPSPTNETRPIVASGAKLTPRTAKAVGFSQIAPVDLDMDWELDEDDLFPTAQVQVTPAQLIMPPPPVPSTTKHTIASSSSPSVALARGLGESTPAAATQFPVRRLGMRRPRPIVLSSGGDGSPGQLNSPAAAGFRRGNGVAVPSSEPESPVVAMGRGRRRADGDSSPARPGRIVANSPEGRRRRGRRARDGPEGPLRSLLEIDAELSGSDSGDTSEHSDSSAASSSDLRFANNFAPTQAPKGYNQRAIYRAGLGTQARGHGLQFKRDAGDARNEWLAKAHKPILLSDDEGDAGRGGSSDDDYELGSFVVNDDDDE
ncbi:hypothetical protein IAU60_005835 [Kwoniella sp. DSM 27419]